MKILTAYDGSTFAEESLKDLSRAGLPNEEVEVLIMEVAEVWLPPSNVEPDNSPPNFVTDDAQKMIERNRKVLADAAASAAQAGKRIAEMFPGWTVKAKATYGSPGWEILLRANEFQPDLITVGCHGRSMLGRIWMGSVSQKIVTEANCSVRVTRGEVKPSNTPIKLVLGYDGTKGADEAVRVITNRRWTAGSEIRVVMVEDLSAVQEAFEFDSGVFERIGTDVVRELEKCGLNADLVFLQGNPKQRILEEAERFGADCIYLGATKFNNKIERFLLGSVSAAITARAHCSVEVVRPNYYKSSN